MNMQQDPNASVASLALEPTDLIGEVPDPRPSTIGRWIAAARPKTLLLTVTPVVAGIALAVTETGGIAPLIALATLCAAVAIQVGTNLHNDAVDYERGTDTVHRLGPPRASAQGWFSSRQVRMAANLAFGFAFLLGLLLVARGGWPILVVGIASLICGYAYTSGPRPIAHGPFGELYVLAFFGVASVAGTYYLQTLTLSDTALLLGLILGLPAAAVLMLNNDRDLETDQAAGRHTLCAVLGRPRARVLYALLLLLPLPMLTGLGLPGATWFTLGALPLALLLITRLYQGTMGKAINPMLGLTGLYQALLTLLLIGGFVFGGDG